MTQLLILNYGEFPVQLPRWGENLSAFPFHAERMKRPALRTGRQPGLAGHFKEELNNPVLPLIHYLKVIQRQGFPRGGMGHELRR